MTHQRLCFRTIARICCLYRLGSMGSFPPVSAYQPARQASGLTNALFCWLKTSLSCATLPFSPSSVDSGLPVVVANSVWWPVPIPGLSLSEFRLSRASPHWLADCTTRLLTGILIMPNRRSRTPVPPHSHWEHLALSCAANQHACVDSFRESVGHLVAPRRIQRQVTVGGVWCQFDQALSLALLPIFDHMQRNSTPDSPQGSLMSWRHHQHISCAGISWKFLITTASRAKCSIT